MKLKAGDCPIFVFLSLKKPWRHDLASVIGTYLYKSVSCLFGPGLNQINSSAGTENGPFSINLNFNIVAKVHSVWDKKMQFMHTLIIVSCFFKSFFSLKSENVELRAELLCVNLDQT